MFVIGFFSFFQALYLSEFIHIKLAVSFFFIDFLMKVIVGTKFSPVSQLAAFIVRNQAPEYVGAVQKRFAWGIGLVLSGTMLILLFIANIQGLPNLLICATCLTFMFMESAFGVCVGCKVYAALLKAKLIKQPEFKPVCPGTFVP